MATNWWLGECPSVNDLWPSLAALKREAETQDKERRVVTSLGVKIEATLDDALRSGRMVTLEGVSGAGNRLPAVRGRNGTKGRPG